MNNCKLVWFNECNFWGETYFLHNNIGRKYMQIIWWSSERCFKRLDPETITCTCIVRTSPNIFCLFPLRHSGLMLFAKILTQFVRRKEFDKPMKCTNFIQSSRFWIVFCSMTPNFRANKVATSCEKAAVHLFAAGHQSLQKNNPIQRKPKLTWLFWRYFCVKTGALDHRNCPPSRHRRSSFSCAGRTGIASFSADGASFCGRTVGNCAAWSHSNRCCHCHCHPTPSFPSSQDWKRTKARVSRRDGINL